MVQRRYSIDEESGKEKNHICCDSGGGSGGSWLSTIRGYAKLLVLIVLTLFVLSFRGEVMTRIFVSGDSMNPTYTNGDVVFLWEYNFHIERYDIVVAKTEIGNVIKRVIGLPGDTILISEGIVYVNGIAIDEYAFETTEGGVADSEYIVSENCYFLLGDNRANSIDSREFGEVEKDMIKGVVVFKVFPPF